MSTLTTSEPVTPTADDSQLAKVSSRQLAPLSERELKVRIAETNEQVILPAAAVKLLKEILAAMAEGSAITMIPIHAELTTQQAADLLGVSRPFLIKQLEADVIPYHKVGTHRRVLYKNLMGYKDKIMRQRSRTLDELSAQAQKLDMGY